MTLSPRTPRTAMKRTPVKRVNRKRKAKSWLRAYGSEARVEFVAALPCICGCERGPCDNAHVVKGDGGGSYKASAEFIAPLYPDCHFQLHNVGAETFQRVHHLDLAACAAETAAAWEARQ